MFDKFNTSVDKVEMVYYVFLQINIKIIHFFSVLFF